MSPPLSKTDVLLSIAIPTFNRSSKLGNQIKTITAQMLALPGASVDLLVLDNASSDGTNKMLKGLCDKFPFVRTIRHNTNLGLVGNYCQAIELPKGKYVWVLGDDDLLYPSALFQILKCLHEGADISAIALNFAQKNGLTDEEYNPQYFGSDCFNRVLKRTDVTQLLDKYNHSSWLWMSGTILLREASLRVISQIGRRSNLAIPLYVSLGTAFEGNTIILPERQAVMVTHSTSWASQLYRKIYAFDVPRVILALEKLYPGTVKIPQFEIILRRRYGAALGNFVRRPLHLVSDISSARLD